MAGRNAKPVEFHVIDGKAKLSKKELERRKSLEIKLGKSGVRLYDAVKADPVAYERFIELAEDFENFEFVSSSDSGIINRLCLKTSELAELRKRAAEIKKKSLPKEQREVAYNLFVDEGGREYTKAIMDTVDFMFSTKGYIDIETAINSKESSILADEDRLFLNSLAKVKSVPKKQEPPADPLTNAGFGGL
jgi:hypothetical protein